MRVITLRLLNTLNTAFSIEDKLRFFTFKRDTATLFTRFIQHFVEVMQLFDVFNQRRVLLTQFLIALQHVPDLGVGQTRMGAHNRFVEFKAC